MTGNASESTDTPLKILITADAIGGVWQYSVDLVAALVRCGAEVLVATMGPRPSDAQKQQLLGIPRVGLVESDFALEWMPAPWHDVDAAGKWLLDLAFHFCPDIIHLNGYSHANLMWGKPVVVTAHSCVYSWWRAVHGSAPGDDWAEYKRRVAEGLAASDIVTAPSAYMAGALQQDYCVSGEKLRVIHNFSQAMPSSCKAKQPFLLAAGRIWDVAKNLAFLEQIAPKINWEIRVAGSERGPEASAAAPMKSARLLGTLPHTELLNEMERGSIFLHPALYEPFGLAVLEAASRKCCLVLSDIPSLRELWSGAARFVDARDPERWSFELNQLIADREDRQRLALRAYSRAKKYGAEAAVNSYWNLYRSLISSRDSAKKGVAA
jgi:glycogen synthase